MTLQETTLFVADTENHCARRPGGGHPDDNCRHGRDRLLAPGQAGSANALNSPWDVLESDNYVYIAMAGTHQIWRLYLSSGMVAPFAGSGRENIDDGPNPRATLAQPSGLTTDEQRLFFADSESSAVRACDFSPEGYTQTCCSASGLFDFGDRDGKGVEVRLQHCLGVAYHDGVGLIADTYNNKVNRYDIATKECHTVLGSGEPLDLYEPGGLSVWDGPSGPPLHRRHE